jgi:hypothetical protein
MKTVRDFIEEWTELLMIDVQDDNLSDEEWDVLLKVLEEIETDPPKKLTKEQLDRPYDELINQLLMRAQRN